MADKSYEEMDGKLRWALKELETIYDRGNEKEKIYVCNVCNKNIKPTFPILFDTAPVCQKCANDGRIPGPFYIHKV